MKQKQGKILILGTGYIGSEIIPTFYNDYDITCIDHGRNFFKIKTDFPKIELIKGDCTDKKILKNHATNIDYVFYAINTGSVVDCMTHPEKFTKINTVDFQNILHTLSEINPLRFFLFSSAFVYPDLDNVNENTLPNPETLYGKLRLKQEELLLETNLPYVILRLANIYGYGHFPNTGNLGAIEKFIQLTFLQNRILLHGDGNQKLNCVFLKDLMKLLRMLVTKSIKYEIFNVSTQTNQSVFDIAKIIQRIAHNEFGIKLTIDVSNKNIKLPNSPNMSSQKIMNHVKWKPSTTDLTEKITEMMKQYQSM